MPRNDIGGFFVSLGMNIDKNSFETGNKLVDGMGNAFNKLIGSARNAAIVLATTAVATGKVESASYKTAAALGVTTEALDVWKASAKIAGVSADSLVSSISKIANVQNRIKYDGSGLSALQSQLDKLQMSYAEIKDLSADQATQKILEKAQSMIKGDNAAEIYAYVEDILGAGARDFLIEIVRQNTSVAGMLGKGQSTVFTDAASNQKAADFNAEVNTFAAEMQSIGKLIGSEVGGVLTEPLKSINEWITKNGPDIKSAIENIASLVGKISTAGVTQDVGKLLSATIKLIGGDKKGALEEVRNTNVSKNINNWSDVSKEVDEWRKNNPNAKKSILGNTLLSEMPVELQEKILSVSSKYWKQITGVSYDIKTPGESVEDGIIRPDGTVTRVAPDDWIFAARNIGDMARAFIPQNHTAISGGEYSIVQNFTINGGTDMPQVLRQQAFMGTKEAMLEMMEQSSRRLQLMSGTR